MRPRYWVDAPGVARRMLFFILLTWAPIMAWAIVNRRLFPGNATEPLLQHFSVHVRCLVAIPLFIAAEAIGGAISQRISPYFVTSGIVTEALESRFIEILRQAGRLRDSWLAWAVLAALSMLLAWHFTGVSEVLHEDELSWAVSSETGHPQLEFGGWWFLLVVRPVFAFFLLHWIWRLFITVVLFWRIAHLDLHLVPTHPDRAGGLGFLEQVAFAFSPIVLAVSQVRISLPRRQEGQGSVPVCPITISALTSWQKPRSNPAARYSGALAPVCPGVRCEPGPRGPCANDA